MQIKTFRFFWSVGWWGQVVAEWFSCNDWGGRDRRCLTKRIKGHFFMVGARGGREARLRLEIMGLLMGERNAPRRATVEPKCLEPKWLEHIRSTM